MKDPLDSTLITREELDFVLHNLKLLQQTVEFPSLNVISTSKAYIGSIRTILLDVSERLEEDCD